MFPYKLERFRLSSRYFLQVSVSGLFRVSGQLNPADQARGTLLQGGVLKARCLSAKAGISGVKGLPGSLIRAQGEIVRVSWRTTQQIVHAALGSLSNIGTGRETFARPKGELRLNCGEV